MLFVVSKHLRSAIAEIRNLVTDGFQFFQESRGAKGSRCFFAARDQSGCPRTPPDQCAHYRLTYNIALSGAPPSASPFIPGSEKAPAALRAAGLLEKLKAIG